MTIPRTLHGTRPVVRAVVALASALALGAGLSACASGDDAVATGGTFQFVSPGGQTEIHYPKEERGAITELSGPDLMNEGKTIRLSDMKGKIVVINTWGQWCGPCREESDDLVFVSTAYEDKGVQFLGVNVRDPAKSKAQDFVKDHYIDYPSIWDPTMESLVAIQGFPVTTTPTTMILDRDHTVAAVFLGVVTRDQLTSTLDNLVAEHE